MVKTIFAEGEPQSITEVLANKDERVELQQTIFHKFPQCTLLDVKLNIPGPFKNNRYLKEIFASGILNLAEILQNSQLPFTLYEHWERAAGSENFYLVNADYRLVKKRAVEFENKQKINRLFDADVLIKKQKQAISRKDLDLPVRKCFLCSKPAKECARSRTHSVADLQNYITSLYNEEFCKKSAN